MDAARRPTPTEGRLAGKAAGALSRAA